MAQITIWGDFKADRVDHLNLSGDLQLLLNQSDINVVNFEAPVKSGGKASKKSGPNLNQNIDSPEWIEAHGFNVVSLANNHSMDYGTDGLKATKDSFKKARTIGAGTWEEAYSMDVLQSKDGLRIGFLAASHKEFGSLTDKDNGVGYAWCMHPDFDRQIIHRGGGRLSNYNQSRWN